MSVRPKTRPSHRPPAPFLLTSLALLWACSAPDARVEDDPAPISQATAPAAPIPCVADGGATITGTAVGDVRLLTRIDDIRRECAVVADTALTLEGDLQPAILIDLGRDTILAEIVDERISRIRVRTPGPATRDSLRVGTPLRRFATLPDPTILTGEGQHFLVTPGHCGISFAIAGIRFGDARRWTAAELAALPDSVRVGAILVTGGCAGGAPPVASEGTPAISNNGESATEPSERLRQVLEVLLRGGANGGSAGEPSWFSSATTNLLRSATVDTSGHAIVDFADLTVVIPNASSSAGSTMLLNELNAAVFGVDGIDSVDYLIEGSCERFWEWLQYGCQTVRRPG